MIFSEPGLGVYSDHKVFDINYTCWLCTCALLVKTSFLILWLSPISILIER